MDKKKNISMAVIKRLPKYHRYLSDLMKNDVDRISSKELSEKIGFTASQIRQDLNCFGDFGQQGYGYNVSELYSQICNILGLTKLYRTVLIGAGNIGQAIANYTRFDKLGFGMKAIFDINPKLIGIRIRDIEINDIDYLADYLKENAVDIGIICVPSNNAQKVCNILVENGVRGIWNFAPVDLIVPEDVKVEDVHLSDSLLTLSCLLNDIESSDS
ncbi:redox-sensing transcriptional repressor Rex [Clostridium luticellarii]|jgi:redox-sensing transcriptional repressor|uniref:Redox-sensing transcriptional repressor Rex n=1 Tax=Clostridium luticellarii TaxID=1691940 RepID=A0A2T0BSU4_9CLOT|nr:redox-sensing transcriptional repressor Rex [Clostridium luticellarii]MCI1946042.1 redox-sensing transcriptional repressor Rex [Clostridium luticellarii]MCI1969322.1 redox-sensing transcriptional repressor Rex [Clostridium luticellarii]MCI1995478.1 redox-sensing transcriptional repressor Rex [Clostridium luticellarii]MCI2040379.1 redox-sensing transcriptional repressor Rex [Clostridium luticellarii]PRR86943.1 Redox-sensing transcriptional repressor Rex [Clostridium luticellarii]